jgi:Protein of unknown function (DUF3486)
MPSRSKVARLPHKLRTKVEHQIIDRAFSGYRQLADKLKAQGYDISEDGLQRHGARLRRDLETVQLGHHHARMLGELTPEPMQMLDSMLRLVHVRLLSALMGEAQLEQRDFALLRAVSDFGRTLCAQQRMARRAGAAKPSTPAQRAGRPPAERRPGLSGDAAAAMRHMMLGEYIGQRAPGSRLTDQQHGQLRESLTDKGVVAPDDPLASLNCPQDPAGAPERGQV